MNLSEFVRMLASIDAEFLGSNTHFYVVSGDLCIMTRVPLDGDWCGQGSVIPGEYLETSACVKVCIAKHINSIKEGLKNAG